jgi:NAD(P)-dependent dehydrogenase (short-subunit alcohol dehydrogenase family)
MTSPQPSTPDDQIFPARFSLRGQVALVTGAAGHLGERIALALGEAGAHVLLNGRDRDRLEVLRRQLEMKKVSSQVLAFDTGQDEERCRGIAAIEAEHGKLDVLVNNAYEGRSATIETATVADFEKAYALTVTAAFRLVQLARPLLTRAAAKNPGGASVVNMGTMYGLVSPDPRIYGDSGANNPPFYGAAKAGLLQLTRYLACHLAVDRIRVNSVSPGPFPRLEGLDPDFLGELCKKTPMNRTGDADEFAGPVLFLASAAASYVTGADLRVDGGWTAW